MRLFRSTLGKSVKPLRRLGISLAPGNTVAPAITGTAAEGQVLTVSNGTWTNTPTGFAYQWKRGGANIGTNANTYTLVAGDVTANITCTVTATNVNGSSSANSNTVGPVTGSAPVNTVAPAATGTGTIGQTLSCTTGTWTGTATITFAYQWKRDGISIASATSSTYTLVSADLGTSITCTVTATNPVSSAAAGSNAIGPISSSGLSAGVIAFDASTGWVTGQNPPSISVALPSDGSVQLGDWYRFEFSTDSGFATSTFTTWRQITLDDVVNSDDNGGFVFSFGGAIAGGLTYFRLFFGRGANAGAITLTSPASNVINDTLASAGATAKLDSGTTSRHGTAVVFTNTDHTVQGNVQGGTCFWLAGATQVAAGAKFQHGITWDAAAGSGFSGAVLGIYNDTTNFNTGNPFSGWPGRSDSNGVMVVISQNTTNTRFSDYRGGALVADTDIAGAPNIGTDIYEMDVDISGAAGTHSYRVYRNGTQVIARTGLTLTGFNRAFAGGGNNAKVTWNPGNTFSHALSTGYVAYG